MRAPGLFSALAMLLLAGLLAAGCATHINAPDRTSVPATTEFDVREGVVFSPEEWPETLRADLYLPVVTRSSPAVLMVHGGGWERRSRQDMTWIAEDLAGRGFMVMNIDHRFAPEYTFPAQLHDLQVAMHWLHQQAGELGVDQENIAGFGFSSGAHLVSLMAVVAASGHELNHPHGGASTRPTAVVAGGLPSDLAAFGSGKLIRQFLGGTMEEMPDTYRAASPVNHVTNDTPPFFLFHGAMDDLVPLEQAKRFRRELAAHEVENQLYIMKLRGHVTSFLTAGNAVKEATAFLARHTKLQGR